MMSGHAKFAVFVLTIFGSLWSAGGDFPNKTVLGDSPTVQPVVEVTQAASVAQKLSISGPSKVDSGEAVVLIVDGTPPPDPDTTWGNAFSWIKDMAFGLDGPSGEEKLVAEIVIGVDMSSGAPSQSLRLRSQPEESGAYVLSVIYWPDRAHVRHRFTVGQEPTPTPTPTPDFGMRLQPPNDPETAKELVNALRQVPWQAAPLVTDTITAGKPAWEQFRQTMQTIAGSANLQTAITVLEGIK